MAGDKSERPTKFITNLEGSAPRFRSKFKSMRDAINVFAKKSVKLDFLVGYFFFSGFKALHEHIGEDTPLRILVGLEAERDVRKLVEKYSIDGEDYSPEEDDDKIRRRFKETQINALNTTEADGPKGKAAVDFFRKKLKNRTLEIRKTKEPNHAKMYLFSFPSSDEDDGRVLIGSSNLSYSGLLGQNEINILLKDDYDFFDAVGLFNALWGNSVPLLDENTDIDKLLEQTWVEAKPTPYLMYVRALYEYFSVNMGEFKTPRQCAVDDESIFDVTYQTDAVQEGIYKIRKHSGCIVADVVGLGKTIVATTIAANLNAVRTVVICPPHLKDQWECEMERFNVNNASVYSLGKIEDAVKKFSKRRGGVLVIVDEAHRFRNEASQTYGLLHRLCAGNKVILLSATPFNNRPQDIFSMVKLFQIPSHATIQTVNNLGDRMNDLLSDYKKLKKKDQNAADNEKTELTAAIRDLLDPVMIRRTRTDLEKVDRYREDLEGQDIKFNELKPPVSLEYDLGKLRKLYIGTLKKIKPEKFGKDNFKATRYCPLYYLKDEYINEFRDKFFLGRDFKVGQRNMATFMQRLLVRRFESCSTSFKKSLENLLKSCETILKWYNEGAVPICNSGNLPELADFEAPRDSYDPDVLDPFEEADEDKDISKIDLNKLRENEEFFFVEKDQLKEKFEEDLIDDINVLGDLLKDWKGKTEDFKLDPKLDVIIDKLERSLGKEPNRKLIIFTEFKDTAEHLYEELDQLVKRDPTKTRIRPLIYTGKSKSKSARDKVRRNFDASLSSDEQKNDYNVLIATDSISEGYSLHRAGTIYNYDIPYNPTRIIQRMGRIDRINKKMFDKLNIYNFFPTDVGEQITKTKKIASFKLELFRAILGADAQFLSPNETPEGYFRKRLHEIEGEGEDSWKSKFLNELHHITKEKNLLEEAKKIPPRARILRKGHKSTEEGVYVFSRRGDDCRFAFAPSDGSKDKVKVLSPEEALKIFRACKDEKSFKVSKSFYDVYDVARSITGEAKTSRNTSEENTLAEKLDFLAGELPEEKKYINKLIDIIKDTGLSAYHKHIVAREVNNKHPDPAKNKDMIALFRKEIPEEYLDGIRKKIGAIASAPEAIVLSEEFNASE